MEQSQQFTNYEQSLTIQKVILYLKNLQAKEENSSFENQDLNNELSLLEITNKQLQDRYQSLLNQQFILKEDFQTLSNILNRAQQFITDTPNQKQISPLAPIFEIDQDGQIHIIEAK